MNRKEKVLWNEILKRGGLEHKLTQNKLDKGGVERAEEGLEQKGGYPFRFCKGCE